MEDVSLTAPVLADLLVCPEEPGFAEFLARLNRLLVSARVELRLLPAGEIDRWDGVTRRMDEPHLVLIDQRHKALPARWTTLPEPTNCGFPSAFAAADPWTRADWFANYGRLIHLP